MRADGTIGNALYGNPARHGKRPRVWRLANSLTYRERRCAEPARRASEGALGESTANDLNEAGADAAALGCQGICETLHQHSTQTFLALRGRSVIKM